MAYEERERQFLHEFFTFETVLKISPKCGERSVLKEKNDLARLQLGEH